MRDKIVYEKIIKAMSLLDEIDKMIESQSEELQKIDYELSDWYHYIENNNVDDSSSKKIMKEIQRLRILRRSLNNEYEIEKAYKNNASKVMGNNTRGLLLNEINKAVKNRENEYKNRVLTEEKINDLISTTTRRGRPKKSEIEVTDE